MKSASSNNKTTKRIHLKFIILLLPILLISIIIFNGCKNFNEDEYMFEFTPDNVTKEISEIFNVFDLSYKTNIPKNIDLKTYKNVDIEIEDESILCLKGINTLKTITEGKTNVEVIINYEDERIISSFNITINSSLSPEENKDPSEEIPEIDDKIGNLTYEYTSEITEENFVLYTLIVKKDNEGYRDYRITMVDKEEVIEIVKQREISYILTLTEKPIEIKIIDTKDTQNTKTIILEYI